MSQGLIFNILEKVAANIDIMQNNLVKELGDVYVSYMSQGIVRIAWLI